MVEKLRSLPSPPTPPTLAEQRRCHAIPIIDPKALEAEIEAENATFKPPTIPTLAVVSNLTADAPPFIPQWIKSLSSAAMPLHDYNEEARLRESEPFAGSSDSSLEGHSPAFKFTEFHLSNSLAPSPDNLSATDDTPGPSDEEKEPSRSRRQAGSGALVLASRFRSRSASPHLYRLPREFSPEDYLDSAWDTQVYPVELLREINNLDLASPMRPRSSKRTATYASNWEAEAEKSFPEPTIMSNASFSSLLRKEEMGSLPRSHWDAEPSPQPTHLVHRTAEPFQPRQPVAEEDQLLKNILGILNKVTPEKYDPLLRRMHQLLDQNSAKIHDQLLERIIGEVHECALDQPSYSEMYATLCSDICLRIHHNQQKTAPTPEQLGQSTLDNFRRILLNKCQARFTEGTDRVPAEAQLGMGPEVVAELAEREHTFRLRSRGNIRFIGELFKGAMLSERIMHKVIKKLLLDTCHRTAKNADALDGLCTLLRTAGRELDRPQAVMYMVHYFNTFQSLANSYPLPRIRFMILDIIALRENGWLERRKETKALKLNDLERELLEEGRARDAKVQLASHSIRMQREREMGRVRFEHGCRPEGFLPPPRSAPPGAGCKPFRPEWNASWGSGSTEATSTPGLSPVSSCASKRRASLDQEWRPFHPHMMANSFREALPEAEEELRFEARAQLMLDEWYTTGHDIDSALSLLDEIPVRSQQRFWVCAMEFTSRTNKYGRYRAMLVTLLQLFWRHQRMTVPAVIGCLMEVVDRACHTEVWVDSPGFWWNLSGIIVDLLSICMLAFDHLVDICTPFFQQQQEGACRHLLGSVMRTIETTHRYHLYNPQVGLTLFQSLHRGRPGKSGGTLHTVGDFLEKLAY